MLTIRYNLLKLKVKFLKQARIPEPYYSLNRTIRRNFTLRPLSLTLVEKYVDKVTPCYPSLH